MSFLSGKDSKNNEKIKESKTEKIEIEFIAINNIRAEFSMKNKQQSDKIENINKIINIFSANLCLNVVVG